MKKTTPRITKATTTATTPTTTTTTTTPSTTTTTTTTPTTTTMSTTTTTTTLAPILKTSASVRSEKIAKASSFSDAEDIAFLNNLVIDHYFIFSTASYVIKLK
jgi:hypothetical protein